MKDFGTRLAEAVRRVENAPYGQKTAIKKIEAERLRISISTFDNRMRELVGRRRKVRCDAGNTRDAAALGWVKTVAEYRERVRQNGEMRRSLCWEDAVRAAEMDGVIPAGMVSGETAARIAREHGVTDNKLCRRLKELCANHVHYFDGSGSEYFYVMRVLPDSDFLLGIRASKDEKNPRCGADGQPKTDGRLLVYYYGVVDGYSRLVYAEMFIASGECMEHAARALQGAWAIKPNHAMAGVPEVLLSDSGPMTRRERGNTILRELGIEVIVHCPKQSWVKGKIERAWRPVWQRFELPFVLNKGQTIRFSELQELFSAYIAEVNAKAHHKAEFAGATRSEVYRRSLAENPPRLYPAELDIMDLVTERTFRVIDRYGCVTIDKISYEIENCPPAIVGKRVLCRISRHDVQVRNPGTLEWMDTRKPKELVIGQDWREFKHDINNDIHDAAEKRPAPGVFFWKRKAAGIVSREKEKPKSAGVAMDMARARVARDEAVGKVGFESVVKALLYLCTEYLDGVPAHRVTGNEFELLKEHIEKHLGNRAEIDRVGRELRAAVIAQQAVNE